MLGGKTMRYGRTRMKVQTQGGWEKEAEMPSKLEHPMKEVEPDEKLTGGRSSGQTLGLGLPLDVAGLSKLWLRYEPICPELSDVSVHLRRVPCTWSLSPETIPLYALLYCVSFLWLL